MGHLAVTTALATLLFAAGGLPAETPTTRKSPPAVATSGPALPRLDLNSPARVSLVVDGTPTIHGFEEFLLKDVEEITNQLTAKDSINLVIANRPFDVWEKPPAFGSATDDAKRNLVKEIGTSLERKGETRLMMALSLAIRTGADRIILLAGSQREQFDRPDWVRQQFPKAPRLDILWYADAGEPKNRTLEAYSAALGGTFQLRGEAYLQQLATTRPAVAKMKVIWVLSSSGNMMTCFDGARIRVQDQIDQLDPIGHFNLILTTQDVTVELAKTTVRSTRENRRRAVELLERTSPSGKTDPRAGLRMALAQGATEINLVIPGELDEDIMKELNVMFRSSRCPIHVFVAKPLNSDDSRRLLEAMAKEAKGRFEVWPD